MYVWRHLPDIANERDVIALEYDPADLLACAALLHVDLFGLVEDRVHVLIEADDLALDAQVRVLEQPDLHPGLSLEELVDQELYKSKLSLLTYNRSDHEFLELARLIFLHC